MSNIDLGRSEYSKDHAFHWMYESYMKKDRLLSDCMSGKITTEECEEAYRARENDFIELCDAHIKYSGKVLIYAILVFTSLIVFLFYATVNFDPYTYQTHDGVCLVEPKNLFMVFIAPFAILFWGILIFGALVQGHVASYFAYSAAKKAAKGQRLFV